MTLRRRLLFAFSCGCARCRCCRWALIRTAHTGIPIPVAPPPLLWHPLGRLLRDLRLAAWWRWRAWRDGRPPHVSWTFAGVGVQPYPNRTIRIESDAP